MRSLALLPLVALTFTPIAPVFAAQLTQSVTFPQTPTDFTTNLSLGQFDPTLGTLNSVTLTFTGNTTSDLTVTNTSNTPQTFSVDALVTFEFSGAGLPGFFDLTTSTTVSNVTLAAQQSQTFSGLNGSNSQSLNISNSLFSAYTGTGTLNFFLDAYASTFFTGGGGNLGFLQPTTASGSLSVLYDYTKATPIPGPGPAIGLLVLGAIGLVSKNKAKRSKSDTAN